jgi:sugar-specific transcriptional regulator TrmB
MDLGLSFIQATTYLNLVKLGEANVKSVAKLSGAARQEIYNALPALEKRGLIQKIEATPTLYRAKPIEETLAGLIDKKKNEIERLSEEKQLLIDSLPKLYQTADIDEENAQFVLASELTVFLKVHESMLLETQRTIDIIIGDEKVPSKIYNEWALLEKILHSNSDLRIRLITNEPSEASNIIWKPLVDSSAFQLKYVEKPIVFGMHLCDSRQVTLQVTKGSILPSLWSNNPSLVELACTYFESLWGNR